MVSRLFEQCKGVGTEVPILLFSCIPKTSRADVVMQIQGGVGSGSTGHHPPSHRLRRGYRMMLGLSTECEEQDGATVSDSFAQAA